MIYLTFVQYLMDVFSTCFNFRIIYHVGGIQLVLVANTTVTC